MLVVESFLSVVDKDAADWPSLVLGSPEGICAVGEVPAISRLTIELVVVALEVTADAVNAFSPDVLVRELLVASDIEWPDSTCGLWSTDT